MIKVFSPAYYAREDTKTPMRYAIISLTANTLGSIALFFLLRHLGMMPQLGIAVATALGGWLNAYLLWSTLSRRGDFIADGRIKRNVPLILLASVAMVVALLGASHILMPHLDSGGGFFVKASFLAIEVGVGLAVFAILILATGVLSFGQLARLTRGQR
jgi:putative peptidoglycan lipid II flippase